MPSIINSDDGSVSGAAGLKFTSGSDGILQIQNNGNTAISVADTGIVTFAQPPLTAVPAFRAYADTDQSITSGVVTRVQINNKTGSNFFDTDNWFDTTNYRYTPQIAGYYFFTGLIRAAGTNMTTQVAYFYKNGIEYSIGQISRPSTSLIVNVIVSDTIYLNGSSDFVELYGYIDATGPSFDFSRAAATSLFSGFLVRAT